MPSKFPRYEDDRRQVDLLRQISQGDFLSDDHESK